MGVWYPGGDQTHRPKLRKRTWKIPIKNLKGVEDEDLLEILSSIKEMNCWSSVFHQRQHFCKWFVGFLVDLQVSLLGLGKNPTKIIPQWLGYWDSRKR